uniref:CAPA-Periviscerokinin-1 n=1 Tax=Austrophasma gansbaaiense TaxID=253136 RepID=PVK1_AUSGA|nr:RecName: Full=CAPA-Periviscerokinin-1; Short=CAPA-PVK-1 [Austrophasma gansbaaiense]
EAAGLLPFPRL